MPNASQFQLNGNTVSLADANPTESLLRWLNRRGSTGTKEGCADGDCGACTVAVVETDARGRAGYCAVNSCLLPVGALPGREVLTVEALADGSALHPVQQAMVECAGSQCGYCTPGFVMSLFAGYYAGDLGDHAIEGNLCRCTGYLPIRRAAAQLNTHVRAVDRFDSALAGARPELRAASLGSFYSPRSVADALALKAAQPKAAWIAGATDLGVNMSHGQSVAPAFIALDRIAELQTLELLADEVRIGAAVSLSRLQRELAGVFPALDQMLPWFAGRQIRNRATVGGNLGSASPIGDLLPVLLALDATIHLCGPHGARAVAAANYFTDYRKTARAADELITHVSLARAGHGISAAYKVAKRQTDDISIVAAVFSLSLDAMRRVSRARLAYGGVAAVPRRALRSEALLIGRTLDTETLTQAQAMLQDEFQPISDHRAGADYRRRLSATLFEKFVAEHCR